jgi:diadenylate cyclase
MIIGLAGLAILSVAAQWLQLAALSWLLNSLRTVWLIGFLILFQPELRKALTQFGENRLFKQFFHVDQASSIGEIQKALASMSEKGLGGIVVIERNDGLRSYAESGTPLEARVTAELLETIFTGLSPLHDGAAIIRGGQVVAAGCILPLSQNPNIDRSFGTRHRAIVGLSEETDAIAIAVSEETRKITVAQKGAYVRLRDVNELRSMLGELLKEAEQSGTMEQGGTGESSRGVGSGPHSIGRPPTAADQRAGAIRPDQNSSIRETTIPLNSSTRSK